MRRGRRILMIAKALFEEYNCRMLMITILRKLPEDAVIEETRTGESGYTLEFKISSSTWEPTPEGRRLDYLDISLTRDEVWQTMHLLEGLPAAVPQKPRLDPPMHPLGACICDFEYTGLKYHKHECPKNPCRIARQKV